MSSTYENLDDGTWRRLVAAVGGGLLVVGPVLPWTTYETAAGETLAGSTAGVAEPSGILVLLGGLAVVVAALFVNRDGFAVAVIGIVAGVALSTTLPVLVEPASFTRAVEGIPTDGADDHESTYGLWLAILGGLVACYEALRIGWDA